MQIILFLLCRQFRLDQMFVMTMKAYNLTRMHTMGANPPADGMQGKKCGKRVWELAYLVGYGVSIAKNVGR